MRRKIHFIYRPAEGNVGDMACAPLLYFYDFFSKYNVIGHDIAQINWLEIGPNDVVILGATGMLDLVELFQCNIKRLYETTPNVIAWSVGFNTPYGKEQVTTKLDFSRFRLIAIRDYDHPSGLEYLPCVSCLAVELRKKKAIQRKIGIIENRGFAPLGEEYDCEKISNESNLDSITDFIATSESIFSSSYHATYWATLMGKRVVCNSFSTKFHWLKYKPIFYSGNLSHDFSKAQIFSGALDEAVGMNMAFWERVKAVIHEVIPVKESNYSSFYTISKYVMADRFRSELHEGIREEIRSSETDIRNKVVDSVKVWLEARLDEGVPVSTPLSVLCFGAGEMARLLLPAFRLEQLRVEAFVDERSAGRPAQLAGCPVIGISDIRSFDIDYILVTCRPSDTVVSRLEAFGIPAEKIVLMDFEMLFQTQSPMAQGLACRTAARYLRRFPGLIHAIDLPLLLGTPWLSRWL